MSLRAASWAWTVPTSPTAKLVLVALADFSDEVGHCWPSIGRLLEMTGLSERAARNALRQLEAEKHIRTERAVGRGHTSRYRLLINASPEKGQDVPVSGDGEKGHVVPEKGHLVPEKGHVVPEKGQEMPPNRKEPSRTVRNHQEGVSPVLPDWLPQDAWADWCTYRRGKTWTQKSAELSIAKLAQMRRDGSDPRAVIHQSIANGWRGLFPIKADGRQSASKLDWMMTDPIFGAQQ